MLASNTATSMGEERSRIEKIGGNEFLFEKQVCGGVKFFTLKIVHFGRFWAFFGSFWPFLAVFGLFQDLSTIFLP